jgi:signal peptidase I
MQESEQTGNTKKENFLKELVKLSLIVLLIVVPFRIFIAQPFVVNGASMEPTFGNGDYLIVDQITYRFEKPERGDVLIFRFPQNTKKFFIKRLIGLPGETINIESGEVKISNGDRPQGFILTEPYIEFLKKDNFSVTLKEDEYFVLGDNRLGSADSRVWGPLNEKLIVGRPIIRLFPLSNIALLPGTYESSLYEED